MSDEQNSTAAAQQRRGSWQRTPVANLLRWRSSGTYFAQVRVRGKLSRESLKTDVFTAAKLRLSDFVREKRAEYGAEARVEAGKMTFGEALAVYVQRLEGNPDLKEGAKIDRRKCIAALLKSWPELETSNVGRISKDACLGWAEKFVTSYSASV